MARKKKSTGDRIVQVVLLALIAFGIFILVTVLGGAAAGAARGGRPGGPGNLGPASASNEENETVAVETATVGVSDVREHIRVNGDVESESSVNIYPDVSGELVSLSVSLGETVRRGRTLAAVDPSLPGQVYSTSDVTADRKSVV